MNHLDYFLYKLLIHKTLITEHINNKILTDIKIRGIM